jgi:hypothetical protein
VNSSPLDLLKMLNERCHLGNPVVYRMETLLWIIEVERAKVCTGLRRFIIGSNNRI